MGEFDLDDRVSDIRLESLTVGSLEFFALIIVIVLFYLFSDRKLICLYIAFLPFTDKVYRVLGWQPSDIIALFIILKYSKYIFGQLRFLYWITPFLLVGSLVGLFQFSDNFGLFYSWRLLQTLIASNIILSLIQKEKNVDIYISFYKKIVYFSLAVMLMQFILWLLGFPVAGIFVGLNLARVKGLASEPSTFAIWLALSLAFGFKIGGNKKLLIDKPYIFSILVGLILTGSATGFAVAVVFAIMTLVRLSYFNAQTFLKSMVIMVIVTTTIVVSLGPYASEYLFPKVGFFFTELFDNNAVDNSGRGSDRVLFEYIAKYPAFGIGAFRSSRLGGENDYIAGANFYVTTPTEFGFIGSSGMLMLFLVWINTIYKNRSNENTFFGFALIGWVVGLAGARLFAFHQPWFMIAIYMYHGSYLRHEKVLKFSRDVDTLEFGSK